MVICKSPAELEKMHRAGLIVWGALREDARDGQAGDHDQRSGRVCRSVYARSIKRARRSKVTAGIRARCALRSIRKWCTGSLRRRGKLREGDILSMDFGVELDGYFGDAALTVPVGKDFAGAREAAEGHARIARARDRESSRGQSAGRCFVRRAAMGGKERLLGSPRVRGARHRNQDARGSAASELRNSRTRPRLQEGMVLAIEPMVNTGGPGVKVLDDEWTAVTADGSDSAHFEHTVAVTANGPWILTRPRDAHGPVW